MKIFEKDGTNDIQESLTILKLQNANIWFNSNDNSNEIHICTIDGTQDVSFILVFA